MDKSVLTVLVAGLVLVACGYGLNERPRRNVADLPVGELLIDGQATTAHIGATPNDRGLGFQYATRQQIRHELIYFRYRFAQIPHFHMTNVAAPLLIAWIGPGHRVIAIERMTPGSCCYEPPSEIIAALELAPEHPLAKRIRTGTRVRPIRPSASDLPSGG